MENSEYLLSSDNIHIPGSRYNWEGLYMILDCEVSTIPVDKSDTTINQDRKKQIIKFIHEYIHFIQNFSTSWGAQIFIDFNLSYLNIASSSSESSESINIPLDIDTLGNEQLKDGFRRRQVALEKLNQYHSFSKIKDGIIESIKHRVDKDSNTSILSNGLISVSVGAKVVKEHMARTATQLYLNHSDEEISAENNNMSKVLDEPYIRQPEYWILFEFFYQMEKFENIAKGIFFLCNYCLSTLRPFQTISTFIQYVLEFNNRYKISFKFNFASFVNNYFQQPNQKKLIFVSEEIIKSSCTKFLFLLKSHKDTNSFLEFSYDITDFSLKNISRYAGGSSLFAIDDNYTNFDYWKEKVSNIGSGVICFRDAIQIYGTQVHTDKMKDNFMYFLSVGLIIDSIMNKKFIDCPFKDDFPICKSSLKGSDYCYRNPYGIVNEIDEDGRCLFGNGVGLLGLDNRIVG